MPTLSDSRSERDLDEENPNAKEQTRRIGEPVFDPERREPIHNRKFGGTGLRDTLTASGVVVAAVLFSRLRYLFPASYRPQSGRLDPHTCRDDESRNPWGG